MATHRIGLSNDEKAYAERDEQSAMEYSPKIKLSAAKNGKMESERKQSDNELWFFIHI